MANELNEMNGPINKEGRDVNVIEKQLEIKVGGGSLFFEIILWILIIPGLIFLFKKINAKKYFDQLQQKIQHNASQIDNFLEQRVQILQNAAALVSKSVDLDKDVMKSVAAYRSGANLSDVERSQLASKLDLASRSINVAFEAYPELRAHETIADAMQQNSYLQKEITAARELYNDSVLRWNQEIQIWPTKKIVAARNHYTTRIPFSVSQETKEQARKTFF